MAAYSEAEAGCNAVLETDPNNVKALDRRSFAWISRCEAGTLLYITPDDIRADILRLLTLAPDFHGARD
eukprot:12918479-Prorocentrum_lima.AAC.1